uniref:G_PROTEIN_RECEP_F1_2 domain-containing protein n=1 Tax=Panagrellus redivivus TaxID=6233 RepID=A0A7E4UUM0_PANRE
MQGNETVSLTVKPYSTTQSFIFSCYGLVSILLGLFLDYLILTQSKKLGAFKYCLLNQCIWSQFSEASLIIILPLFFENYLGGFMAGPSFRQIGSYNFSVCATIVVFCMFINAYTSVVFSVVNRFVFVFHPSKRALFNHKFTISGIVIFHIIVYIVFAQVIIMASSDGGTTRRQAHNEAQGILDQYFDEPTFIYISENGGKTRIILKLTFYCMVVMVIFLFACIAFFLFNVIYRTKTTIMSSKVAKSLVIDALLQTILCIFMLIIPIVFSLRIWGWNVRSNFDIVNHMELILCFHGFANTLCTLFCVVPYRRYFLSCISNAKSKCKDWTN